MNTHSCPCSMATSRQLKPEVLLFTVTLAPFWMRISAHFLCPFSQARWSGVTWRMKPLTQSWHLCLRTFYFNIINISCPKIDVLVQINIVKCANGWSSLDQLRWRAGLGLYCIVHMGVYIYMICLILVVLQRVQGAFSGSSCTVALRPCKL